MTAFSRSGVAPSNQTAILAEMSGEVYSMEPRPELAEKMGIIITELGYDNVHIIIGDG
jgi:protein-L-isoaspartate(D-aspartate) O-methyltransferase